MNREEKDKIKSLLDKRLATVIEIRFSGEMPHSGAGPAEILEELLATRQRLDRVEGYLLEVSKLRGKLHSAYAVAKTIAEDAWSEEFLKSQKSMSVFGSEYSTGRERSVQIEQKIIEKIRDQRIVEELSTAADETLKAIRIAYHGLDGTRQDLLTRMKTISFESSFER